ncbi:hypothetical protein [Stagnihabitans tardus]|uniref:Uncharacterized protein n=1 Tax=Stagnihabitans tardus TaxID=2699202 RepID=A0AAE5BY82_9RHOB|nr:hypothetical protein [Stagnihabitans tardus]NBZ90093.1 hypothetical protein [Stagnihabitans tardus]
MRLRMTRNALVFLASLGLLPWAPARAEVSGGLYCSVGIIDGLTPDGPSDVMGVCYDLPQVPFQMTAERLDILGTLSSADWQGGRLAFGGALLDPAKDMPAPPLPSVKIRACLASGCPGLSVPPEVKALLQALDLAPRAWSRMAGKAANGAESGATLDAFVYRREAKDIIVQPLPLQQTSAIKVQWYEIFIVEAALTGSLGCPGRSGFPGAASGLHPTGRAALIHDAVSIPSPRVVTFAIRKVPARSA